jgi:hypothetical protein
MPRTPKVKYDAAPVEATVHLNDQRVNIPTAEQPCGRAGRLS